MKFGQQVLSDSQIRRKEDRKSFTGEGLSKDPCGYMSIQYNSKAEEKSLFRAKTAGGDSCGHQWRRLKECQNMRWKAISKSHGTPSDGAKSDLAPSLPPSLRDTVGNC